MKMKFKLMSLIMSLVLSITLLSGCGDTPDKEPEPANDAKISDYFPMQDNVRYVYEGEGNEYASYNVYHEFSSADKIQQRVDNGGTVMARVYELKDGKLTRLLSKGEVYYRENLLSETDGSEEVVLMEPLEEGTTWTLTDGQERTITNMEADVSTPLGDYKAIEVITEGANGTTTDYYAKDIGLVKTVFKSEDSEVSSSLAELEEDVPRVQLVQFYFPNINDSKIYFKNKEVEFRTNDDTNQVLADAYKGAIVSELGEVFTTNTKINSLTLSEDNKVLIDLNGAFKTEMNAGAEYESMILQSITNTFGNFYNVEEVILTVDGKPYESGHILMEEGQSMKVNLENTIELDV